MQSIGPKKVNVVENVKHSKVEELGERKKVSRRGDAILNNFIYSILTGLHLNL